MAKITTTPTTDPTITQNQFKASKQLIDLFQQSGASQDMFHDAIARASTPDEITDVIKETLKLVAVYFQKQQANSDKAIGANFEFLKVLAELSPTFADQMNAAGLTNLQVKDILHNSANITKLHLFVEHVLKTAVHKKMYEEMAESLAAYSKLSNKAAKEQAQRLRAAMGSHHITAQAEDTEMGARILANKVSNSMFDKDKILGIMANVWFQEHVAAYEENLRFPFANFSVEHVPLDKEPQREQYAKMYNNTNNIPGAPAGVPVAAAAPARAPGLAVG